MSKQYDGQFTEAELKKVAELLAAQQAEPGRQRQEDGMEEIDLLDTVEYDYVYFTKNSGLRPVIDSCFSRIKRQPTIAYEGEEDSSVAGLVAAGFGIAIVPKIPLLDTMDVCVRPIISPEIERYIYLVLKKDKYLTPIVKDFISFITEQSEFA